MSTIDKIETVIGKLDEIGVTGAVFASISWSFAMSLAQAQAALRRFGDDSDPEFARLTAEQREERMKRLEARVDDLAAVVSWAKEYATSEYLPAGALVVERLVANTRPAETDESLIAAVAEALEISVEQAREAAEANDARREETQALQRRMLEAEGEAIAAAIDRALEAHCPAGFDFEGQERDAIRVLERIADRCERYEANRVQRAMLTRRARMIATLGAERKLLAAVMNDADALAVELAREDEATTAAVVEGQMH